jgi:pyrophosphatase PpaX
LEKDHIYDLLDMFVAVEDVKVPKPDPEGILKVLESLSIDADETIMVGDTEADILAGRNAKTHTAGALYGMKRDVILELKPDFLLEDIADILLYV